MLMANGSRSVRDPSDEELMNQLATGRVEAFGPLHARYAPLVFSLASRSLGRDSAEELVQEIFLTAWRSADAFDPARGNVRGWILRITHSRILNELRRRGRRPKLTSADGSGWVEPQDAEPAPPDEAWRRDRRASVRAALEALPPPQRDALRLAFLHDLSHSEVADALHVPLGTVKTRIRAGLQRLRHQLAPLAMLLLAASVIILGYRNREQTATLDRRERALIVVTSSDVVPRRLSSTEGVPPETHGQFRGRHGVPLAVLTVSNMPRLAEGRVYRVWARFDGRWEPLGEVRPNTQGRSLAIVEGSALESEPEEIVVSDEPDRSKAAVPGRPVIRWSRP
jgi:RNA polymerase sigma-70 factor, ECF subfamily